MNENTSTVSYGALQSYGALFTVESISVISNSIKLYHLDSSWPGGKAGIFLLSELHKDICCQNAH